MIIFWICVGVLLFFYGCFKLFNWMDWKSWERDYLSFLLSRDVEFETAKKMARKYAKEFEYRYADETAARDCAMLKEGKAI